ncbi:MAG: NADH pyrophosphatase, partial [Bacteroidaceae bacterium]|nr:NADH pyrophosphatase [Bacteroidaceae bacterium]
MPTELPKGIEIGEVRFFVDTDGEKCYVARSNQENLPDGMMWMDLRESFHVLPEKEYRMAGKASELLYFDRHHRYCGLCGGPMEWSSAISKRCTHCGEELWPK